jgi:nucleotide-binding universal stress UspA family protein
VAALRVAIAEASRRGVLLRVVTACDQPNYWALPAGPPSTISEREIVDDARLATQSVVEQVLTDEAAPPKIEVLVEAGPAVKVLVDAAQQADLLVVGHRGRGGFSSMLLGSVGLQCVLHAPCTVTVVRKPARAA